MMSDCKQNIENVVYSLGLALVFKYLKGDESDNGAQLANENVVHEEEVFQGLFEVDESADGHDPYQDLETGHCNSQLDEKLHVSLLGVNGQDVLWNGQQSRQKG